MISILAISTAAVAPLTTSTILPCDGIRLIEATISDRPLPFASLREQGKTLAYVPNAAGQRVQQEVPVTNVKTIAGFARCRFVYTAQIDLACYVGATLADTDTDAIAAKLVSTADSLGSCLTNSNLVRAESEPGSTPSISFGGGARQPFWQVSMVPTSDDPSRVQPEILVLGPAPIAASPVRIARSKSKTKRKAR